MRFLQEIKFCVAKSENCEDNIIQAHSISKKFLRKIAKNGRVISIAPSSGDFEEIGIRQASTFRGFCGYHDKELFKCFEDHNFDFTNPEHIEKLSLRTLSKEYLLKMNCINSQAEKFDTHHNPSFIDVGSCFAYYRLEYYKNLLLTSIWQKKYNVLDSVSIIFNDSLHCLASGAFFLENDINHEPVNLLQEKCSLKHLDPIILNLIPLNNDTIVTISFLKNNKTANTLLVKELPLMNKVQQKELISKLIFLYTENFYLSTEIYKNKLKPVKTKLVKHFHNYFNLNKKFDVFDEDSELKNLNFFDS
ncbi:MAG: hypothetical protein HRT47_01780 [Candidatus Caenarcaniphilales bacterium]|nr:hypothetical protein [Candidatus Caenarcaniphilales bacterium]